MAPPLFEYLFEYCTKQPPIFICFGTINKLVYFPIYIWPKRSKVRVKLQGRFSNIISKTRSSELPIFKVFIGVMLNVLPLTTQVKGQGHLLKVLAIDVVACQESRVSKNANSIKTSWLSPLSGISICAYSYPYFMPMEMYIIFFSGHFKGLPPSSSGSGLSWLCLEL